MSPRRYPPWVSRALSRAPYTPISGMNLMRWADSMTLDATTSSRFSERVVDVIGSASASLLSGKMSGHNFSPVVRSTSSDPVMPGMMMIGGLPVCLATIGAGKMADRFGLLALSRHALVATTASARSMRKDEETEGRRGGEVERKSGAAAFFSLRLSV